MTTVASGVILVSQSPLTPTPPLLFVCLFLSFWLEPSFDIQRSKVLFLHFRVLGSTILVELWGCRFMLLVYIKKTQWKLNGFFHWAWVGRQRHRKIVGHTEIQYFIRKDLYTNKMSSRNMRTALQVWFEDTYMFFFLTA